MAVPKVLSVIGIGSAVSVRRGICADAQFSLVTCQFDDSADRNRQCIADAVNRPCNKLIAGRQYEIASRASVAKRRIPKLCGAAGERSAPGRISRRTFVTGVGLSGILSAAGGRAAAKSADGTPAQN